MFGILVLLGIAWALSEGRKKVQGLPILLGIGFQFAVAFALLRLPLAREMLLLLNHVVDAIETATTVGTSFVFGFLGGGDLPFELTTESAPYIFAFRILPQILIFSVLVALFWYWKILPAVIRAFSWALQRTLGVGGAVGVAASASVFLGMVEAPLVIRAYLKNLSRSEFFVVMTCGMSTVAGSIMVLYANVLGPVVDGALGHILTASMVNVLGAVVVARIMIPEDTRTDIGDLADALGYESTMDAISRGTLDGLRLVANVGSMLIVLVSLIALVNFVLSPILIGEAPLTLERALGWMFAPIAWLMGIPWGDAQIAGTLLGTKVILNELVAFIQLGAMPLEDLSDRSRLIMTYALCGFANFGSLGILIGGISALVPERRSELLRIAPKSLISGTIVNCMTGAIVGVVTL
ncbi:MAG: nucleoside:proton symporter [Gammaproteobacteria bacterium]|nr:nucleoside:proton symporter [Gammaproteobacteria bacterium]